MAVCLTLLTVGCLATIGTAHATPSACADTDSIARYLIVFPDGTTEQRATTEITSACGLTSVYYPEIAVAVASSADPGFGARIGADRVYSAGARADAGTSGPDQRGEIPAAATGPAAAAPREPTGTQWDMSMIGADRARHIDPGSHRVVVGVLDSGIDPEAPLLDKALDAGESVGCVTGRPDPSPAAWVPTASGHGTEVAAVIAAADDGHGFAGVAPGVRVASIKVVDDDGFIYPEAAVCGFMWAARHGMTITNNSYFVDPWIFTCPRVPGQRVVYTALLRAIDYATAHGVLSIAAAGNQAVDLTNPGQDNHSPDNVAPAHQRNRSLTPDCVPLPAGLPGVVTVSAIGAHRVKAGYSSYGLGAIDVTAPGGDRRQRAADGTTCVPTVVPTGYGRSCGTSMAAPHVAGVAALLASTHPSATPAELAALLDSQAHPIPCPADYDLDGSGAQNGFCTGDSSYNGFYGHGLVDAVAAVTSPAAPPPAFASNPRSSRIDPRLAAVRSWPGSPLRLAPIPTMPGPGPSGLW